VRSFLPRNRVLMRLGDTTPGVCLDDRPYSKKVPRKGSEAISLIRRIPQTVRTIFSVPAIYALYEFSLPMIK
jgi:hypothetical protein